MIWDCFMFRDELDMLEGRLTEMQDLEVTHVLVESGQSHRGDPKPLHYAENADRFAPWKDRIVHVVAEGLDWPMDPWPREHVQRNAAMRALEDRAELADTVLICDVDEFVPLDAPQYWPAVAYRQRLCMYAVDWEFPERHICSVATTWSCARDRGLAAVRDGRYGYPVVNAGWHLTWLGGIEAQREKLRVTCHTEMTPAEYDRIWSGACYERGEHHSGTCQMIPVDVDETWPQMIWRRECPASWFRPRP